MTTMTCQDPAAASAEAPRLGREAAEELAGRICAHAARQARDSCDLLVLIGEFDAGHGWAWSDGMRSVAHWLAWTCSMTPATAREHVRVARALRRMPTVTAAFGAGELSYSKVREITRVVDVVDESRLCELARYATASQLARMISSFRSAAGTRIRAEGRRLFRLIARDGDPMTGLTGRLPAEEAATVTAAIQRARDLNTVPPTADPDDVAPADPDQHDATPPYTDADALLEVCRHYLGTATTDDESGEDRCLVIVEIAAEQLEFPTVDADDVPAGTTQSMDLPFAVGEDRDVPAGTPQPTSTLPIAEDVDDPAEPPRSATAAAAGARPPSPRSQVCTVRGIGAIEPRTAQRLICTGSVLGAIVDQHGDVLALGRTRRLVSKRQRRALLIRDQQCQFPGCWRDRHLQAHHRIPWSHGGTTDLANLILLCGFHHTAVHEGGVRIVRRDGAPFLGARTGDPGRRFLLPDGQPVAESGWRVMTADHFVRHLSALPGPDAHDHDETSIRTVGGGEGFSLHNCVEALFSMISNEDRDAA